MKTVCCRCVRAIMRNSDSMCTSVSLPDIFCRREYHLRGAQGTTSVHAVHEMHFHLCTKFYWIHISHICDAIIIIIDTDWKSRLISSALIGSMILANAILSHVIDFDWFRIYWKIRIRFGRIRFSISIRSICIFVGIIKGPEKLNRSLKIRIGIRIKMQSSIVVPGHKLRLKRITIFEVRKRSHLRYVSKCVFIDCVLIVDDLFFSLGPWRHFN